MMAAPNAFAMMLHPLIVKTMTGLCQPLQWRGGLLYAAWKGQGLVSVPSNHRSLFVSSMIGKTYHKALQNKAQQQIQGVLHGLHLGSRQQVPTTFAPIHLASHFRTSKHCKRSAAALYLDTKAAYYRLIRELAMGHRIGLLSSTPGLCLRDSTLRPFE